ncbi:WG repeat-containing protein [Crassaminicella profunda]|uniref:WG repeat-containing protein n=1 Tax=Crassaminicella profunda TaxID=1286698 RepID=UPI001CA794B0|nr:WG repeat-containing protein [Crassaminicella profunda]QZY56019.1 WG repeat-containing protein [Crassaminicella profunda]
MKKLKLFLSCICFLMIVLFPFHGFTEQEIKGTYEKSSNEVLFNTGVQTTYLDTYTINGQEDVFICIEDLEALGYEKKWHSLLRKTIFTRKGTYADQEKKYFIEDLNFSIDTKILKKNAAHLKSKGNIYKSDVSVYVGDKNATTYNANGYSLIGLNELKRLKIPYFFLFYKETNHDQKLYPLLTTNGYGVVDLNGNLILKPQFDKLFFPENNAKNLLVKKDGFYWIIDRNGNFIKKLIQDNEEIYTQVKENYIIFNFLEEKRRYKIFDFDGNDLFHEDFRDINVLDENHIFIKTKEDIGKVYKKEKDTFEEFYTFEKPIYKVFRVDKNMIFATGIYPHKVLVVDKDQGILSEDEYPDIHPFSNGYAVVELANNRYAFVNEDLKRISSEDYRDIGKVHNNLFAFLKDGKYDGRSSSEGLKGATFGLMDIKKGLVLPPEYKKIRVYKEGAIRFSKVGKKYGILDLNREIILDEKFDHIFMKNNHFYALKNDTFYIYDTKGTLIAKEKNNNQYDLRENTGYFVQFWDDGKKDNLPAGGNWSNDRPDEKLPLGIKDVVLHSFRDEKAHHGFGNVNSILTKDDLLIPYALTYRGCPVPPPDSYFPTYLIK